MSAISEIEVSKNTVLTKELKRQFLAVGCDPTCHACEAKIEVGSMFKLVLHQVDVKLHSYRGHEKRDEMCCEKCGSAELLLRDKRDHRRILKWKNSKPNPGGYSRPSAVIGE